ncbi:hypothetical protein WBG78_26235 [Chryseolinea sp. T2]|uniref:hypothetical protein n=1 Tax=Chryseolinea sp. T2 TaxID=3129255 RepID=UPI0030770CD4
MRQFVFLSLLIPFLSHGQTLYSGPGNYDHKWFLKINPDSSIVLLRNIQDSGFDEYLGRISRKNDSLFVVKVKLHFEQEPCLSINESALYIHFDSIYSRKIGKVAIVYSNSESVTIPVNNRTKIEVPLSNKISRSNSDKEFFYVTANHKNPIDNSEMRTHYKNKDSYCLGFRQGESETFRVIIKDDKVRKFGKVGSIPNFTLSKISD